MKDVRMKLSPPWVTYFNKVKALFEQDPDIELDIDYEGFTMILNVNNPDKAAALVHIIKDEMKFGNIYATIETEGKMSNRALQTDRELFETAFEHNPAFAYCVVPSGWFVPFTYVVFKKCVVQFFNDNLDDPHGVLSTLYANIANEVLIKPESVSFCTDVECNVGRPLGEWP